MPDGVLPDDYTEPMPEAPGGGGPVLVYFAGEAREMVNCRLEHETVEYLSVRGWACREPTGRCEVVQRFACGAERTLDGVTLDGEMRLRPRSYSTTLRTRNGHVQRVHADVHYRRDEIARQIAECCRAVGGSTAYAESLAEAIRQFGSEVDSLSQGLAHGVAQVAAGRLPARPPRETALHGPVQPPPVVHESPEWIVHRADSPVVAAFLGHGTAWCTAYPSRLPIWRDYADGELYVVTGRGNRARRRTRYQIHVDPCGDVEAERQDGEDMTLGDISMRHPALAGWLSTLWREAKARRKARR